MIHAIYIYLIIGLAIALYLFITHKESAKYSLATEVFCFQFLATIATAIGWPVLLYLMWWDDRVNEAERRRL
jgi:hypothetical protein